MTKRSEWLDDHDLAVLAESIREAHRGGGSFDLFIHVHVRAILSAGFEFRDVISPTAHRSIVRAGMNHFVQQADTSGGALRAALRRAEAEHMAKELVSYVYVTSVSVEVPYTIKRTVGDARVEVRRLWPPRVVDDRAKIIERRGVDTASTDGYSCVAVAVSARSVFDAASYSQRVVDLVRASWNFILNQRTALRVFGDACEPVNEIRLGEYHTVHNPDFSPATETLWFDPNYRRRSPKRLSEIEWRAMRRAEASIYRGINGIAYSEELRDAFVRYTRALDAVDHESAFLKLWSILELLTHAQPGSDQTIRRTLAIFDDASVARIGLEQLRRQRNLSVHHDSMGEDAEDLLFQLKFYVESLIRVHLGVGGSMRSLEEMGAFLQLPEDSACVSRQIELRQAVLAFRSRRGDGDTSVAS